MSRVWGSISPVVQARIGQDIALLVDELLVEALERWRSSGWSRFDDREANCTIRIFHFAEEATREIPKLRILSVLLEWSSPTPEMLAGTASATTMVRPDLRIRISQTFGLTVECKRLAIAGGYPQRYVGEGMDRFVSGTYAAGETDAMMIGYVQGGTVPAVAVAINEAVSDHPAMGASHRLLLSAAHGQVLKFESAHVRTNAPQLALGHLLVDVQ